MKFDSGFIREIKIESFYKEKEEVEEGSGEYDFRICLEAISYPSIKDVIFTNSNSSDFIYGYTTVYIDTSDNEFNFPDDISMIIDIVNGNNLVETFPYDKACILDESERYNHKINDFCLLEENNNAIGTIKDKQLKKEYIDKLKIAIIDSII